MLLARVVGHQVHHQADLCKPLPKRQSVQMPDRGSPALPGLTLFRSSLDEVVQVREGAQFAVDVPEVGGVQPGRSRVGLGRLQDGAQGDHTNTKFREVVDFLLQAFQVPDTIPVRVFERSGADFVDRLLLPVLQRLRSRALGRQHCDRAVKVRGPVRQKRGPATTVPMMAMAPASMPNQASQNRMKRAQRRRTQNGSALRRISSSFPIPLNCCGLPSSVSPTPIVTSSLALVNATGAASSIFKFFCDVWSSE